MKCSNCGFETNDNVKFCPECGAQMVEPVTTTTTTDYSYEAYTIDTGEAVETETINQNDVYQYSDVPQKGDKAWACFAGFGCGIGMFFINPCYSTFACAVVFSIIGMCGTSDKKVFAYIGIGLAGLGFFVQLVLDLFTGGVGIFI